MPHRKTYSTVLRMIVPIEVRAMNDHEAAEMIDTILHKAGSVVVYDGTPDYHDGNVSGHPVRIERDVLVQM